MWCNKRKTKSKLSSESTLSKPRKFRSASAQNRTISRSQPETASADNTTFCRFNATFRLADKHPNA